MGSRPIAARSSILFFTEGRTELAPGGEAQDMAGTSGCKTKVDIVLVRRQLRGFPLQLPTGEATCDSETRRGRACSAPPREDRGKKENRSQKELNAQRKGKKERVEDLWSSLRNDWKDEEQGQVKEVVTLGRTDVRGGAATDCAPPSATV